jgi:hypothetical protein
MVEPWWRPDEASRDLLTAELRAELSPGHPLFGRIAEVQNRCGACDAVTASVAEGSFAIVHLTWSGHREAAPWPQTVHAQGHG